MIDLSSETTAEGTVQLTLTSVSFQSISTSISTQLTPSFPIQPNSTSAVATIPSSASPSPIEKPPKRTTKPRDIRLKSTGKYEILFPDFYYSASKNTLICKICSSFATRKGDRAFVERPGNICDHPTERFTDHLKTKRHKEASKNKMAYLELCNRGKNVWKLAREVSLASNTSKSDRNRFVIKSFFPIYIP